jgi:hypothetical protein
MQACKPGSVEPAFRQAGPIIYLALTLPSGSISLPVTPVLQLQRATDRFRGRTYLAFQPVRFTMRSKSLSIPVGSYPTFSPFPPTD